jgi:acetyl esterase/lipase
MKRILSHALSLVALICAAAALSGCSPLVLLNAAATGKGFSRQDDIAYGPLSRQKLDVYVPDDASGRAFPVVVFFYGGGWESGKRQDYRFVGAALASRGVMAVVADYRIYPEVVFRPLSTMPRWPSNGHRITPRNPAAIRSACS